MWVKMKSKNKNKNMKVDKHWKSDAQIFKLRDSLWNSGIASNTNSKNGDEERNH